MPLPTVLFLDSNASDTTRLRVVAEVREIQRKRQAADVGEVFRVATELAASSDLQSLLLLHTPAMLHFLENDQGRAVAVQSDVLAELLALAKREAPLRCVLLNACFTASQAQAIAENVDCVIGSTREIDDHAAIAFATGFYLAIAFGESIGTAFELGRNQVELCGSSSYDAFRLFHRPQVEPRRVFLDGPNASPREFLPSDESSPASPSTDAGEDYALVIGVNHYPQLRPLRGAIADAEEFADWLLKPNGGCLPTANVRVLLSTESPLSPIGHEIDDALEDILKGAERTGGRRFYFYFSGHGAVGDRANDLALCMANWSNLRRRAALSADAWLDVVVRSGMFDEVAFFLDCCRVWATRVVGLPPRIDFAKPMQRATGTRVFMAYATEFQRTAIEVDYHSERPSSESRGIFTHALMTNLKYSKTAVTAASLKRDIERDTEHLAREAGYYQRAEVLNGFDDGSRFGSGGRHADASQTMRRTPLFLEYKKVEDIVKEWGKAYEDFRQHAHHQVRRPAKELSTGSSRLQLVVCPRESRPRLRISSDTEWSIYTQGQPEPMVIAATASELSTVEAGFFFSGNLTAGAYVLRHEGSDVREFAVHLFHGWTTLIIIDESHEIFFENMKLFIIPGTVGETLPTWSSIESAALEQTLMNWNSGLFAKGYVDGDVSFGEAPMLRLIHAYLLARQPNPSYTRIESIAGRVKAMIGPCADVDALLLRAALIRGGELPPVRFTSLPMLREGLLAIVEASHKMPELIPPDSLLEYACVERLVDSPISSWSLQLNRIEPRYLDSDDWLTNSIEDLAMQSHGDMATLDATTIARELGVPTRAVTTRIEVTRERMTRKDGRSVSSTADTSSKETKPINVMMPDGASIPSIPGYQLERVIGKGGMGEVYLAKHIATEALTAVKVFKQNAGVSIKAIQRFSREIDTLAVLQHDRIIKLLDHGYANGCFFFAMPYYERGNVADWVRRHGAPTIEDAVSIIRDVLEGLAYAHERRYVHRDIKPQNLLLDNQNRVLLADFGLAKEFEKGGKVDAKERSVRGPITTVDPRRNPRWMGTPAFMPEEQTLYFANVRPSSDVWSLAAVLYWLLCGFTPRDKRGEEIDPHNQIIPIRERRPDLQLGLSNLLDMALAPNPDKRPADAAAFRSLLEEALKGPYIEHLDNSRIASVLAINDAGYPRRWRTEDLDWEPWYMRLPRAPGKSPFQVKGLAYKGLLHFVTKKLEGGVGVLAASVPNALLRDYITQTFLASTFYDAFPLVTASAAAADLVNIPLETFAQNQGRAQALYDVGHAFRAFVQGRSIDDFPSRCKLIASRYYNFGEWEATSGSPGTVTFVVKGIPAWASPWFGPMLGGYASMMVQHVARKNASFTVYPTRRGGTTDGIQTVIVEMDISF